MEHIKTYQTEKSIWLGLILWGTVLLTFILSLFFVESIIQKGIVTISVCIVAVIWFATKYFIKENFLIVKIGPFKHSKIDIHSIKTIKNSKGNLIASPANSFNRIAIQYGQYDELLLSPKNRVSFLKDLLKVNSSIKIDEDLLI